MGQMLSCFRSASNTTIDALIRVYHLQHRTDKERDLNLIKDSNDDDIGPHSISINQSLLDAMVQVVFVQTCRYLTTSETILMMRLSKSVRLMISTDLCCRSDYVSFSIPSVANEALLSLSERIELRSIRYAKRLSLQTNPSILMPKAIEYTRYALTSGHLESLYLVERAHEPVESALSMVLMNVASPSSRLRELHIRFENKIPLLSSSDPFVRNLQALKQCKYLRYLYFEVGYGQLTPSWPRELFDALPNFLEDLTIKGNIQPDVPLQMWKDLLRSLDFLPILKRFYIFDQICYRDDIADVLTTTVMSQTERIRPILYWLAGASFDTIRHFPLEQLELGFLPPSAEQVLSECPADLWPDLKSLAIIVQPDSTDWMVLSNFLNQRFLTELDLCVREDCTQSVNELNQYRSFCRLPSLRCLHLTIANHSPTRKSDLFEPDSFPHLTILHLTCEKMSIERLDNMLTAAYHCRHITITNDGDLSPSLILAMTLYYCRSVVSVDFNTSWVRHEEHVDDVKRAFERYPINANQLFNLTRVKIDMRHYCDSAYHYLLTQLAPAPRLQAFHDSSQYVSFLRLCMPPMLLSNVKNVPMNCINILIPSVGSRRHLIDFCIDSVRVCSISPLERKRRHKMFCLYEDVNEMLTDDITLSTMTVNQSMTQSINQLVNRPINQSNKVPVFQLDANSSGYDGRQRYVINMLKMISQTEQAKLLIWHASDYSMCTNRQKTAAKIYTNGMNLVIQSADSKSHMNSCTPEKMLKM